MGECCSTNFTHRAIAETVELGKSVRYCLQSVGVVGVTEHVRYSFHWIVDEIKLNQKLNVSSKMWWLSTKVYLGRCYEGRALVILLSLLYGSQMLGYCTWNVYHQRPNLFCLDLNVNGAKVGIQHDRDFVCNWVDFLSCSILVQQYIHIYVCMHSTDSLC